MLSNAVHVSFRSISLVFLKIVAFIQLGIAGYKINGEQLFFPNAAQPEPAS
jgi:ABC-type tungstate transport system permease subunit